MKPWIWVEDMLRRYTDMDTRGQEGGPKCGYRMSLDLKP